MKYFATAVSIVFLAAVVWVVFFSGLILNKKLNNTNPTTESPDTGPPANGIVVLSTSYGPITIELDRVAAPQTAANFEKLVRHKFYDGLTMHRIIPGFVIQGGDPAGDGTGGPGYTVPAEIKLPHKRGCLAMARTGDQVNPTRASSGSQFYICLSDLPSLDGQYTVFGQVLTGMDVVDKIASSKTGPGDKPLQPVIIINATMQ